MPGMSLVKSTILRIERVIMASVIGREQDTDRFFCQAGFNRLFSGIMRTIVCVLCLLLTLAAPLRAADRLDTVPRVAVVSAFEPEWKVLKASLGEAKSHSANGVEFVTGTLAGRKVVLFLSGIS